MSKLVGSTVSAVLESREQLKPITQPLVMTGKAVASLILGTLWKTAVAQVAAVALWIGAFIFTYLTTQSYMMMSAGMSIFMSFLVFVLIPGTVFLFQLRIVRNKLIAERARVREAQEAAMLAQAEAYQTAEAELPAESVAVHA